MSISLFFILSVVIAIVHGLDGNYFSDLASGPMVGHTTDKSAKIWGWDSQTRNLRLYYQKARVSGEMSVAFNPRTQRGKKRSAQVELRNLAPATSYNYEIRAGSKRLAAGSFTTAPVQGRKAVFSYLLTSCMDNSPNKGYPEQPVWDVATSEGKPSFGLLNGDTIYMRDGEYNPSINYDKVWRAYERIRNVKHLDKFIATHPVYGSWDDHDFGRNDAKKDQRGKDVSLQIWKDMWANPYTGVSGTTGNFYDFYWGDSHFIVLDNRWYREGGSVQFGNGQLNWLEGKLQQSKGVFKVIVAGTHVLHAGGEVNRIGRFVTKHKIAGVVFHTGDIHRNDFRMDHYDTWPYPVVQFTSSGIGRHVRRPFAVMIIDTTRSDPEMSVKFYRATTSCAWKDLNGCPASKNRWEHKSNVRCRNVIGDHGKVGTCAETIRLSELTPGASPSPTPSPTPSPPTGPRPPFGNGMCGYSGSQKKYVHDCVDFCTSDCATNSGTIRRRCGKCDDEDDDHGPPSPPTPTPQPVNKVYRYLGCYRDRNSPRTFAKNLGRDGKMTNSLCSKKCKDIGYDYSATEAKSQCFCGRLSEFNNAKARYKVSDSACNGACAGNSREKCGGSWLMSIHGYVSQSGNNAEEAENKEEETENKEEETENKEEVENNDEDSDDGLSNGAIAGLVIGLVSAVLLLIIVILVISSKKGSRRHESF